MSRRASRSSAPTRALRSPAAGARDPIARLRALEQRRGTPAAREAFERWEDDLHDAPDAFRVAVEYLARDRAGAFTTDERWFLVSLLTELAADPTLQGACDQLAERLEAEARSAPGYGTDAFNEDDWSNESPVYAALADAWESMRVAIEVAFLRDVGLPEMARAYLHDGPEYERALRDGESSLLGLPRIVLGASDDPFGILLP
jgi:hypothetical protein